MKSLKVITGVVLVLLFSLSVSAGLVSIQVTTDDYQIEQRDGEDIIVLAGEDDLSDFRGGEPRLPGQRVNIMLPPGSEFSSVEVIPVGYVVIKDKLISAGEPLIPMNGDHAAALDWFQRASDREALVYAEDKYFPEENYRLISAGIYRKYSYVSVLLYPFKYNPVTKELKVATGFNITVNYDNSRSSLETRKGFYSDEVFRERASKTFQNFHQYDGLYHRPATREDTDGYDYLIVVPTIDSNINTMLSDFISWKESIGHHVKVIDYVNDCGSTPMGLRDYLKDNYLTWSSKYLLIISNDKSPVVNPNNTTTDIPMIKMHPPYWSNPTYGLSPYPGDHMYADLTGDWDSNGNGKYGEYDEYYQYDEEVDIYPELYVGRIPFTPDTSDNRTLIKNILDRISVFDGDKSSYKENVILAGTVVFYQNETDYYDPDDPPPNPPPSSERVDGANIMEKHINDGVIQGSSWKLYETEGITPTSEYYPTYTYDGSINQANVYAAWNTGNYGALTWFGHGAWYGTVRTLWVSDDGDGYPESSMGELSQPWLVGTWYDRTGYPDMVIFSGSCLNSEPEHNDNNLGKEFLSEGCVSFLGASRVSFGNNYQGDPAMGYGWFKRFMKDGMLVGEAFFETEVNDIDDVWFGDFYGYNLYGDPGMSYFGVDLETLTVKTISPCTRTNTGSASINSITGTGFQTGAAVKLQRSGQTDITGTSVTVSNSHTLSCDFDLTDKLAGKWNCVVTNPDATSYKLNNAFTICNRSARLYTVSPSTGNNTGPTDTVNISGEYFAPGIQVYLARSGYEDQLADSVNIVDSQNLEVVFDLYHLEPGLWNIKVKNPFSLSTSKPDCFEVVVPGPYISGVTPNVINPENGIEFKVHGYYFKPGCEVKFIPTKGGEVYSNYAYIYATSEYEMDLICNFDFLTRKPGYYDCRVTNSDKQTFLLSKALYVTYEDFSNMKYYPNPSHGEPIVFKDLPADTQVFIYDISGTLVETLYDTENDARIEWNVTKSDGSKVPSGIYMVYLKGKGCERTVKVAILK